MHGSYTSSLKNRDAISINPHTLLMAPRDRESHKITLGFILHVDVFTVNICCKQCRSERLSPSLAIKNMCCVPRDHENLSERLRGGGNFCGIIICDDLFSIQETCLKNILLESFLESLFLEPLFFNQVPQSEKRSEIFGECFGETTSIELL